MKKPSTHRSIAALKLSRKGLVLISIAKAIAQAMDGNKSFPNPDPTVVALHAAIADLEAAETAVQSRAKGAVAARDVKRTALILLLEQLRAFVQKVADADRDHATELIQSAAMTVKKVPIRTQRVFGAKPGTLSGSVALVTASAGGRAAYEWEYSADGGKTWQAVPATVHAKTTVSGLQPGVGYQFRYRSVTKAGPADWSQPVVLIVK
jgi:hypothetical protein